MARRNAPTAMPQHGGCGAAMTRAMLDGAFAAIPAPAFFTDAAGAILEANAAGRILLERDRAQASARLQRALRSPEDPGASVTSVPVNGSPEMRLVVLWLGASTFAWTTAVVAWCLTPRQTEVLALVVEGAANRTIAAALGVSERTVEVHLTAIFDKAQVESRVELAAAVWRVQV